MEREVARLASKKPSMNLQDLQTAATKNNIGCMSPWPTWHEYLFLLDLRSDDRQKKLTAFDKINTHEQTKLFSSILKPRRSFHTVPSTNLLLLLGLTPVTGRSFFFVISLN